MTNPVCVTEPSRRSTTMTEQYRRVVDRQVYVVERQFQVVERQTQVPEPVPAEFNHILAT